MSGDGLGLTLDKLIYSSQTLNIANCKGLTSLISRQIQLVLLNALIVATCMAEPSRFQDTIVVSS